MAFTSHWDIKARFISCRFHCLTVVKFSDNWFLAGKLCIVMSVQHNQFYTNSKKLTIYFNLQYIKTPIKKMNHLLLRSWSTCKVWFEISYGWVRFLCFSWPLTIIQIWFKKSKMQKDSRLVTITRLKHNCANHIRYIRLLDTIKDIKFRTRHYICWSLTNSRGSRVAGPKSRSRVQSRGRGSNVAVAGPMSRQGKMIWGSR